MRWLAGVLVVFLAACGAKESPLKGETEALLADHDDVTALEIDTVDMGSSIVSPDTMTVAPDLKRFPGPCITVEKTSAVSEVLHLRGCGTPSLKGDLTVRWELRALALHVDVETHDFFIGSTFLRSGSISAELSASGQDRTMGWEMHLDGTLKSDTKPRSFTSDTFKTLRWTLGVPCLTTDGTSTGTVEARKVRVTFTGFRLCAGVRCPEPNSRVRVDNLVTHQFIAVRMGPQGHAVIIDVDGKILPIRPVCAL